MVNDPELLELAWTLLLQEWDVIVKMCKIAAHKGGGRDDWREGLSEVAEKLPETLLSYDSTKGRTLRSHVIGNCRWHLFALFVQCRRSSEKRMAKYVELLSPRESVIDDRSELHDRDEVQYVLSELGPLHASVLRLYYMCGMTYDEIAGVLECSKSTARRTVLEALYRASSVRRRPLYETVVRALEECSLWHAWCADA